jgi:CheY-like chemotaxis protein
VGRKEKILVIEDDRALRHALCSLLENSGFFVDWAEDGIQALEALESCDFDLVLLDFGLPKLNGLEVLTRLNQKKTKPKTIVMTADDTPETVLRAIRQQAYRYVSKPFPPASIVEIAETTLAKPGCGPIEVLSALPDWVELLVPCDLDAAERIQTFLDRLKADLPDPIREAIGRAFRELLLNAIEWGGQLDPERKVRIAYLRARRMVMYRISDPGPGFSPEALNHAAIANPAGEPLQHTEMRDKLGLRPGGFGLLMVKAMVDELIYNEARNEVVFVKYLD